MTDSRDDVRMRGFTSRTEVSAAVNWIETQARRVPWQQVGDTERTESDERWSAERTLRDFCEAVALEAAHGRVLAESVEAAIDVPPFDRAAMDGYALRAAETHGAGDYNPLSFGVVGESTPGRPFAGRVEPQTAVRIMTGAPVPDGADAVLPAEYAAESDGRVQITTSLAPGKHVGRQGEDVAAGTRLLEPGRRLRPQDVALAASVGAETLQVVRQPRVRLVITGDELAVPGGERGPFQIYDANSVMLSGLVVRDGGLLETPQYRQDNRAEIEAALLEPGADVILVSGGSSVGAEDHAPLILAERGELAIHGIAMRPSSPTGLGRIDGTLVCLLPGNPVSCLCAYDFFAGTAIRLMGGRRADWPYRSRRLPLGRKIVSAVGRLDYCRVQLIGGQVEPLAVSGASILSSTTRADGFVVVPSEAEGYAPGSEVEVFFYDEAVEG